MLGLLKEILGLGSKTDYADLIRQGAIIVDVRTPGEYASGHISGSINIPLDKLSKVTQSKDKDQYIITCCASGIRSASAQQILRNKGYLNVHDGGSWVRLKNKL